MCAQANHEILLNEIRRTPGASKEELRNSLGLSKYKMNRALRLADKSLSDQVLVRGEGHGIWLVDIDPDRCRGVTWQGDEHGGYSQCSEAPEFPDGRCYEHSEWENAALVALVRRLEVMAGPRDPNAYNVGQLNIAAIEDLIAELDRVQHRTRHDVVRKNSLMKILMGGLRFAQWKDMLKSRDEQEWIPPELGARHKASSVNPFEYSLRKHFATLGISSNAGRSEVLRAWRRLAQEFHPDRPGGSEEKMKAVNLAKDKIFRIKKWDARPRKKQRKGT